MPSPTLHTPPKPSRARPTRFPVLVSYAFLRSWKEEELVAYFERGSFCDFLLDSGAFSVKNSGETINLDDYIRWLKRWKRYLFAYAALDVIGDPAATTENLVRMLDAGLKPMPVHVLGDGAAKMDELFSMSDYVALGGLKRPGVGKCPPSYVKQKMVWAAGRRVHWFGYATDKMVRGFRPYSCDVSTWANGARFGILSFYHGNGRWDRWTHYGAGRDPKTEPVDLDLIDTLREFGYTVAEFRDRKQWLVREREGRGYQRAIHSRITVDSYVRFSLELWRDWGVRLFLADMATNKTLSATLFERAEARLKEYLDSIGRKR